MSHAVIFVHDHPHRDSFPQQLAFFEERILPMVQAMPGFKSGDWGYDPGPSRTHSYVVFATKPDAQRLIDHVRAENDKPNPFQIKLLSATLVEHSFSKP
jgi:hypothetical protein